MSTDLVAPGSVLSPIHILQHKREAELCDGAFVRYQPIAPVDRSRFSPSDPAARVELGLGYIQAVLAALHGVVTSFRYDPPGLRGHVELRSTGSSASYRFTWHDDPDAGTFVLGGFVHSAGKPTYQAALITLVQAVASQRCAPNPQSDELVDRWFALVRAMADAFPREAVALPWDRRAIALACRHTAVRPAIVRVADALRVCLAFRLPDLRSREPGVIAGDSVDPTAGVTILAPGALLLNPHGLPPIAAPSAVPEPAHPDPAPDPAPPARPKRRSPAPTTTPRRTRSPRSGTATPDASDSASVHGPQITRIQRALERGGPVLLVGPTATGKTTQALAAARALGFGIELVTLDEGWEADDLYGGYTRTQHDREWAFVAGPVTRWAERAGAGERVVLLIDELARGHKTVVSAVMRLMNPHPLAAVAGMQLPIPEGEAGPFHIVDIRATQQRRVIPCHRVRIVATANQGEGYVGLDLSDPAFGRRWTGGWLQLTGYAPDTTARILGDRLGIAPTAPLIQAMQQVALQVSAYQRTEASLRATLDLATLIAWGQAALALHSHTVGEGAGRTAEAFQASARDLWLDRICPLEGAEADPQVERALLGFITAATPRTLE